MKRFILISVFSITAGLLMIGGCSTTVHYVQTSPGDKKVYDSAFPQKNTSKAIANILRSIKRISCSAYYRQYNYPRDNSISLNDIHDGSFKKKALNEITTNNSVAGTATIIYNDGNDVLLLTCAHVINFPDTVVSYYKIPTDPLSRIVKSVSIKQRQVNMLIDVPDLGYYKVLAKDTDADLALLGMSVGPFSNQDLPVFSYPIGKPGDLQWGSFVYVLGYPKGYKMITHGIVSEPDKDHYGSFMLDALFNKGMSGGVVLAIRNGVPNFEWVGIVSTVAASSTNILKPDENKVSLYDPYTPYKGNIYINRQLNIEYGIDQAISVNRIKEFIRQNKDELLKKGYDLNGFFNDKKNNGN